ncbi:MAG: hypothetical protein IJM72_04970, partial [Deltaproteobacteria bacterium]|nr:hypothetical protein [Deltaproteobacteria bacterium]
PSPRSGTIFPALYLFTAQLNRSLFDGNSFSRPQGYFFEDFFSLRIFLPFFPENLQEQKSACFLPSPNYPAKIFAQFWKMRRDKPILPNFFKDL